MEPTQEELDLLKQIAERQRLREQIQRIQAQKFQEWQESEATPSDTKVIPMPVKRTNFWQIGGLSVAASIALLIGFLSWSEVAYTPMSAVAERSNAPAAQDPILQRLDEGIVLLQNGKPAEAITIFDEVEATPDLRPYYRDAATWYEVVALLKADKKSEAKILLQQIESSADFQYDIPTIDKWKVKWKLLF
jgi:hypothetical protein